MIENTNTNANLSGEDFVTISMKEYNFLLMRDKTLSNLEANGVDNWDGWEGCEEDEGDDDDTA